METASLRPQPCGKSVDIMAGTGTEDGVGGSNVGHEEEGIIDERIGLEEDGDILRKLNDPSLPSPEEIKTHCLQGHIPYRSWCHICVRAQGRDRTHVGDKGGERNLPEYSWDYCFPGDEFGNKLTILVGKERKSKAWMAAVVPEKGARGRYATDKCLEFIAENGDAQGNIIVKTDQENPIKALIQSIIENRPEGKTIPEESPKSSGGQFQSSGSNGIVERGVQDKEGKIRAIYLS